MMGAPGSGGWLTLAPAKWTAIAYLALSMAYVIMLVATAPGKFDWCRRPLGTEFSEVCTAGQKVWDGTAARVGNCPTPFHAQQTLHHSRIVDS